MNEEEYIHMPKKKTIKRLSEGLNAKDKQKKPTNQWAYCVQRAIDEVGFEQKEFKRLLFSLQNGGKYSNLLTYAEIHDIINIASKWKTNPKALFWKLLKERKAIAKKKMDESVKENSS